jgi:hypothetical protein
MEKQERQDYATRIMRAAPAAPPASDTARRWKYYDVRTRKIEFHDAEQTQEHLALIRPPVGATASPKSTDPES